jgi:hypothetical protein
MMMSWMMKLSHAIRFLAQSDVSTKILNDMILNLKSKVRDYKSKLDDFESIKNKLSKYKYEVGILKVKIET